MVIAMSCAMSIPCFAQDKNVIFVSEPTCLNAVIMGEEGTEKVIKTNEDGSFITELIMAESKTTNNCPHLEYRDIGKPSTVYSQVNKTQHKKGTRQLMECVKCKKRARRYYGWIYYNHAFNKNNVCVWCNYKKS